MWRVDGVCLWVFALCIVCAITTKRGTDALWYRTNSFNQSLTLTICILSWKCSEHNNRESRNVWCGFGASAIAVRTRLTNWTVRAPATSHTNYCFALGRPTITYSTIRLNISHRVDIQIKHHTHISAQHTQTPNRHGAGKRESNRVWAFQSTQHRLVLQKLLCVAVACVVCTNDVKWVFIYSKNNLRQNPILKIKQFQVWYTLVRI